MMLLKKYDIDLKRGMFALYVSLDAGCSYDFEREAETLDELRPRMAQLDEQLLRWYLTKDGKDYHDEVCRVHREILYGIEMVRQRDVQW